MADTAAPRDDARLEEAAAADARPPGPQVCDGCPPYRPGTAMLQTTGLNVVYGVANLLRGQASARISPASWWRNMKTGWVWDSDDFLVNSWSVGAAIVIR